ncbi:MAG TPA: SMP-30/gluconolactonase/LRE family protein [Bryobacteraceae bacterium]|nr:SMP-30/gluconolactonase/LRE family protein [Bryobacteraceae bacterium]
MSSAVAALAFLSVALPFFAQDFSDLKVEKVAARLKFADGAVWSTEGFLIFCDVPSNKMMKFTPGQGVALYRDDSNGAGGIAFDDKGRMYVAETRPPRVIRIDKKGKLEVLADKWESKPLNSPNDLVVSKNGDIYFTDPAFGKQVETGKLDFFGVYHISPKGELSVIAKPQGRPNGITFSPNGKILYVSNTDERNVRAYDIAKNGLVGNERVLIKGIPGAPAGLKTDEKGNIYVTAAGVVVYSPEGKHLHTIELSEAPANLAFGDPDLQTLYITARTSVYRVRLNVKGSIQH